MLEGRIAVVTGAADGIGRGIAETFAGNQAIVVVADINEEKAVKTSEAIESAGGRAWAVKADVSDPNSVNRLFAAVAERHGRVDIIVNNAGIVIQAAAQDLTFEQWNRTLAVNLTGVFLCSQGAARLMTGGGSIINIASVGGHVTSHSFSAYAASKSGVHGLTRALAIEWGERNIRVNSVSPGSVGTAMSEQARAFNPEAAANRDARVPLPRRGRVDDVAQAALFFASDQSAFVTGRDLVVDGGILAQHPGFVK